MQILVDWIRPCPVVRLTKTVSQPAIVRQLPRLDSGVAEKGEGAKGVAAPVKKLWGAEPLSLLKLRVAVFEIL